MITPVQAARQLERPARGRPVWALALVLGGWVFLRALTWGEGDRAGLPEREAAPPWSIMAEAAPFGAAPQAAGLPRALPAGPPPPPGRAGWHRAGNEAWLEGGGLVATPPRPPSPQSAGLAAERSARPLPAAGVVGHTLLLAAGLSRLELPMVLVRHLAPGETAAAAAAARLSHAPPAFAPVPVFAPAAARDVRANAGDDRWSADAWALWREEAGAPPLASRPVYGGSQAGAALRYRLAPGSRHEPQAHLRVSTALADPGRQAELAAGVSLRPVPQLPVRVYGEARLARPADAPEARYAAYAVSEFPPLPLPGGAEGEAYVQAGYVGGEGGATAFVDGQARIGRALVEAGGVRVDAGVGAWGGAQEGAGRLDVGPSAGWRFRLGEGFARISADYRVRVAGGAGPASGPSITVATGF